MVTCFPDWVYRPPQDWVSCWLPGKSNSNFQLVSGLPRFVRVIPPVKPTFHELAEYTALHPTAAFADVGAMSNPPPSAATATEIDSAFLRRRKPAPRSNLVI